PQRESSDTLPQSGNRGGAECFGSSDHAKRRRGDQRQRDSSEYAGGHVRIQPDDHCCQWGPDLQWLACYGLWSLTGYRRLHIRSGRFLGWDRSCDRDRKDLLASEWKRPISGSSVFGKNGRRVEQSVVTNIPTRVPLF